MNVYPSRINTPRRVYIYIYMNFFKREHFSCSDQFINLNRTIWVPATLRVWGPGFLEVNVIPLQKGSSKKKKQKLRKNIYLAYSNYCPQIFSTDEPWDLSLTLLLIEYISACFVNTNSFSIYSCYFWTSWYILLRILYISLYVSIVRFQFCTSWLNMDERSHRSKKRVWFSSIRFVKKMQLLEFFHWATHYARYILFAFLI